MIRTHCNKCGVTFNWAAQKCACGSEDVTPVDDEAELARKMAEVKGLGAGAATAVYYGTYALVLLAALAAIWLIFVRPVSRQSDHASDDAIIAEAEIQVRAGMRDPDSVQFQGVGVHVNQGAPIVCGEVNAKNGLGGYAGFQRFIYMGSRLGTVLESNMAAGEMNKSWDMFCRS